MGAPSNGKCVESPCIYQLSIRNGLRASIEEYEKFHRFFLNVDWALCLHSNWIHNKLISSCFFQGDCFSQVVR